MTASHAYTSAGTCLAQVSAVDSTGASAGPVPTAVNVSVTGQGLTANLTASPEQVVVGQTVMFTATASTPNTGAIIQNFTLNFGDGTSQPLTMNAAVNASATATDSYTAPGTYTATVTATDNMGTLGRPPRTTSSRRSGPSWALDPTRMAATRMATATRTPRPAT